jgi:hypothetical protein
MSLRVVGAGWPRTGTTSLKVALETLLSSRCYHMFDLLAEPGQIEIWEQALKSDMSGVHRVMAGYGAALDWPASFFWRELLAANPEAVVLLSVRDPFEWWRSMSATIVPVSEDERELAGDTGRYRPMMTTLMRQATGASDWSYQDTVLAAYERNITEVRNESPPGRLVEWSPGDGWGPICAALGVPEPDRPFPWVNTSAQFNKRIEGAFGPPSP